MEETDQNQLIPLGDIERHGSRYRPESLRKKIQRGEVPYFRVGRRIFVEKRVLEALGRGKFVPARTERIGS